MIRRPRLKGHLTFFPLPGGPLGVYGGAGEMWRVEFDAEHGRALAELLPFLDGARERESILEDLGRRGVDRALAARILERLAAAGLIEESGQGMLPPEEGEALAGQVLFFSRFSRDRSGAELQLRLREARVDVLAGGRLARSVAHQLRQAGIGTLGLLGADRGELRREADRLRRVPAGMECELLEVATAEPGAYPEGASRGELLVVAPESWDPKLLDAVNDACLASRTPWLLVQTAGLREGIVGPLFVPGGTACFRCLQDRLRSNLAWVAEHDALESHLRAERRASRPAGGLLPHFDVLAGLAVGEAIKLLTGIATPRIAGAFLNLDWMSLETEVHPVLRMPRCSRCRPPAAMEVFAWSEPPVLESP